MKSIFAAAVVALSLSSHFAFAACGGGGWSKPKPKVAESDNAPAKSSDTAIVQANNTAKPATTTTTSVVKADAAPVYIVSNAKDKQLDTAQFDAVSAKLGLSEDQWKDVQKAKSDISDELQKLQKNQRKAEHKYATCDGDCSSEYNKLNRTTEALKSYDPLHEFDRRLAEILQPHQLQTYEADSKDKVSAIKKS